MQEKRAVLLVEGTSDFGLIRNLWMKHYPETIPFEIEPKFSDRDLLEAFRGSLLGSEVSRLGVVVDADSSVEHRWPGVYQALVERGYRPVPKSPLPEGTVIYRSERTVPLVGVWVMPNNVLPGALEDFARYLIRADDELYSHAERVVEKIPEELRRFREVQRSKVHIHTWLAWQSDPGLRLGLAMRRRLLDSNAPEAVQFVQWLHRLFVAPPTL
ncbi:MAG: DUF3226 domain-containing protein [Longimicrobiaceae bacterium]